MIPEVAFIDFTGCHMSFHCHISMPYNNNLSKSENSESVLYLSRRKQKKRKKVKMYKIGGKDRITFTAFTSTDEVYCWQ